MSKIFKSAAHTGRTVEVDGREVGAFVLVRHEDKAAGTTISKLEAPAFALAILEAAGLVRDGISGDDAEVALEYLYAAVATREREAKEAADREAQTKRRDDLAKELGASRTYTTYRKLSGTSQRAIDRIIELEDRATR